MMILGAVQLGAVVSHSDLFIIGGGINGAGIAADAAGRGLTVTLCEQDDLASATSSASSKLIHGGLRYLEHYEFSLVKKALAEREILLKKAPHIIKPLQFILPHQKHLRPAWMIRAGLFLYDHLAKRKFLPKSRAHNLKTTIFGNNLKPELKRGFSYYDCQVDDARLVVLNALSAKEQGATILTRSKCILAKRHNNMLWYIKVQDQQTKIIKEYTAKAVINAAGPWASTILPDLTQAPSEYNLSLVKGSHIVVPKLYEGEHAYILQNADNRIVFAIPYEQDFTLIGTTDLAYEGNPAHVEINDEETDYLISLINGYFEQGIQKSDILWSYSGVRPLLDDDSDNPSAITRDYKITIDDEHALPLVNIFGGKVTTYRTLAEQTLAKLQPYFPEMTAPWTANDHLPGGDLGHETFDKFFQTFHNQYAWLTQEFAHRLARSYGARAHCILRKSSAIADLGHHFGANLYEKEVVYLIEHEWAQSAEDILWRRSKLGLRLKEAEQKELTHWLSNYFSQQENINTATPNPKKGLILCLFLLKQVNYSSKQCLRKCGISASPSWLTTFSLPMSLSIPQMVVLKV
ncbi:glycerol-3-phosphate dehydrogenase [Piscirickettsia litoralis]|uniref:glycerol-3-phosphate dehydrogenase n=1 Tax=Piscirickettsia litoralis TaxID=1891921 RepID=UPI000AE273BA|nr:glycerol-3-phosphate dehydrogenase [Piscirickettsia litoralis]